jgi:hypothetical protein
MIDGDVQRPLWFDRIGNIKSIKWFITILLKAHFDSGTNLYFLL